MEGSSAVRVPVVKAITNVPKCPNLGQLPASQSGSRSASFEFRKFRPSRFPAVKAIANVPKMSQLGTIASVSAWLPQFEFRVSAVKTVQRENTSRWVGSPVQNESLRRRIAVCPVLVQYETGIDAERVGNGEMTNRVISNGKSKHPSRRKLAMASPACIRP